MSAPLCSKLKAHWTNIAHHLYLKTDAPVPLPAVGPLAELLNVTRSVCHKILALAAAGSLTAGDIATACDTNTVRLLGRLVQWLQAEPHEQLLLNTERSESLWQLLLLTLANMLKVLQPDHDKTADKELIHRFKQQLQASGLLGQADSSSSSSGSSDSTAVPTPHLGPPSSGLLAALQWLLQHHPHRCLSASMGAWLLLQELWVTTDAPSNSSSSSSSSQSTDTSTGAGTGGASAGAAGASTGAASQASTAAAAAAAAGQFSVALEQALLPSVSQVLQAYIDCAYRNVAHPPILPVQQVPVSSNSGNSTGRNSNGGTPVRKIASREKMDSPSSLGSTAVGAAGTPKKRHTAASAAAAAAAPDDGSSSPVAGSSEPKAAAEADSSLVLRGCSHAVCLLDDPSTAVFKHLLALLHSLQIQLVVLAASLSSSSSSSGGQQQQQQGALAGVGLELPYRTHLQVLALANNWLSTHAAAAGTAAAAPQTAATAAAASEGLVQHAALLPLPSLAVEAVNMSEMGELSAVQQLVVLCGNALQADCFRHVLLAAHEQQQQQQQQQDSAKGSAGSSDAAATTTTTTTTSSSSGNGVSAGGDDSNSSSSSNSVDPALVFKLLLESVCLQQACGCAVPGAPLEAAANAAHCCTQPAVQQLLQQHGAQLLATLLKYISQDSHQQQQEEAESQTVTAEHGSEAAAAAAEADAELAIGQRCVVCAQVFLEVCSTRRAGAAGLLVRSPVDEHLLGLLTETDPATFYTIMDILVRKVHPDSLALLLPMSACFLMHDMSVARKQQQQQQQEQEQGDGNGPSASAAAATASTSSSSSSHTDQVAAGARSMVILHDPDVCRTFAAALHGYCKTTLGHLLQEEAEAGDCSSCCGHDHDLGHEHDHEHGHEHHHHHHHHHAINMGALLFPMQQVSHWLLFSFDLTMSAMQQQAQQLAVDDAAADLTLDRSSSSNSNSSGDKTERLLAAVKQQAKQMQSTSQAAAGSLVLTVLLARAAVPVLVWLQQQIKQAPAAAAAGSSSSSSSGGGGNGVVLTLPTASNLWSSLGFVRNVWQVVCARYCLSQMLEEQLHQLLRATAKAAEAAAALKKRAEAAGDAAGAQESAAAAAEKVAKVLKAEASATSAAVHGRGLARGWSHLAFLMPPAAISSARTFQSAWPGDLFEACKAAALLDDARDKLRQQHEAGASTSSSNSDDATVVVPAQLHQELLRLVSDALAMVTAVMDDVPLPVGCNNPSCTRIEAVAEATLSINKRCSQCLAAHYCCKGCQVEHWPAHKVACKRLRQQLGIKGGAS